MAGAMNSDSASTSVRRTLLDKIWEGHIVAELEDGTFLLHVDRHLVHEMTSYRAFDGVRRRGMRVRNPELTFAVIDHIVATSLDRGEGTNPAGRPFIEMWRRNCSENGITHFDIDDPRQGIVHVIGPELGIVLPGSTVVCGDSHTASNGAVGALAWGIGTSEVEHVLATQTIIQRKPKSMRLWCDGRLGPDVSAKDVILYVIGKLGTAAGRGYVIEYGGPVITALSIEERLTVCNMSIELGARAGLVAPDGRTFDYLAGSDFGPKGRNWDKAVRQWQTLRSEEGATFDREVVIEGAQIKPQITWGTSPQDVIAVDERLPDPAAETDPARRAAIERSLRYIGLAPGDTLAGTPIDYAFIGSCTNGRYSDLVAAAGIVRGRKVARGVRALVVPGSTRVKLAAERAGLDKVFIEAGFEWRAAGCSMCVAGNGDVVPPGKRCISTSNRNFEGRQGPGSRTHLASPASVAAAAVTGMIVDLRALSR
jgi:3-isopropylmalate/(R)-2-methylmalate dehydratase large subunit